MQGNEMETFLTNKSHDSIRPLRLLCLFYRLLLATSPGIIICQANVTEKDVIRSTNDKYPSFM
jgi:hypothetical protein